MSLSRSQIILVTSHKLLDHSPQTISLETVTMPVQAYVAIFPDPQVYPKGIRRTEV